MLQLSHQERKEWPWDIFNASSESAAHAPSHCPSPARHDIRLPAIAAECFQTVTECSKGHHGRVCVGGGPTGPLQRFAAPRFETCSGSSRLAFTSLCGLRHGDGWIDHLGGLSPARCSTILDRLLSCEASRDTKMVGVGEFILRCGMTGMEGGATGQIGTRVPLRLLPEASIFFHCAQSGRPK
jgi:hypothetical protein